MSRADDDDLGAWLQLLGTPGIGRERARRLLAAFGDAATVLSAGVEARSAVVGRAAAQALAQPPDGWPAQLEATRRWLAGGPQRGWITLGDARYPAALLETADPPLLLYLAGRAELLAAPSVAIVGSRHASAQGLDHARQFGQALSAAGYAVVSGLALGIDAAAHEGALRAAGSTVAVIGTGPDIVYPLRHRALAERIEAQGLVVSEFPVGTQPLRECFPQRNRIIAGLARGTLVVEAALQSGSLITARLAAEAGRDVFAIPGSIQSPQARGCHALIRQGAKLVETVDDVLEELGPSSGTATMSSSAKATAALPDDADTDPLLAALGHDPVTLDALQARTGWSTAELSARLLTLELDDQVARLPGGLYQRRRST